MEKLFVRYFLMNLKINCIGVKIREKKSTTQGFQK